MSTKSEVQEGERGEKLTVRVEKMREKGGKRDEKRTEMGGGLLAGS